jgi:hypothetical protein
MTFLHLTIDFLTVEPKKATVFYNVTQYSLVGIYHPVESHPSLNIIMKTETEGIMFICQGILSSLWNPNVHYRVHKSSEPDQSSPPHLILSYFSKISIYFITSPMIQFYK